MESQEINPPITQASSGPKLVYVFVMGLVLVVVGVGGYLLGTKKTVAPEPTTTPKTAIKSPAATISDETAGWKTYKDSALGFEFKYPSMLSLKLEKPDNYRLLQLINQKGVGVGSLVYYDNPDGLSLKEFENKLTSEDRIGEHVMVYTPTDEEITTVRGETGFLNKNGVYEPNPSDLYIFPRNKKIFIWIRYQGLTEEYKREDFENQILSTFKFLPATGATSSPQAVADETAGWKMYRNDKYGYSLRYPSDWVVKEKCFADSSTDATCFSSTDFEFDPADFGTSKGGQVRIDGKDPNIGLSPDSFCAITPTVPEKCEYYSIGELSIVRRLSVPYAMMVGLIRDNKLSLVFHVKFNQNSQDETIKIFDQILATFKFL